MLSESVITVANADTSLGFGAIAINVPYKEYDMKVMPIPIVTYKGDNFWVSGLGGGYYLFNSASDKISIMGYYDPMQFKHEDSDNEKLQQLTTRKGTMMAGLSYVHNTQYGSLRVALTGDVLGNSNGVIADMAWLYRYINGSFSITPAVGLKWNSENQNDYYYGISRYESRRSGLGKYNPDSDTMPYAELTVNYRFLHNWNLYGVGRWSHLNDEVTDSPMVENSWNSILSIGVTYSF